MDRRQISLFTPPESTPVDSGEKWELPNLAGQKLRLGFDTETTGLDPWKRKDKAVGMSLCTEDLKNSWYIPWAHATGFNFELENVVAWAKDNLKDQVLDTAHGKFEVHMLRPCGIDLEALGCELHDVQYHAPLIDEAMKEYNLNVLAHRFLGKNKVELTGDTPIWQRSSEAVRWYARYDALLTSELRTKFAPMLESEDLTPVAKLEDDLIYCVTEMERNGAPMDVEKLTVWEKQCVTKVQQNILAIHRLVGFRVIPSKPNDLAKLFHHLDIEYQLTPTGLPSFTGESLKKASGSEAVRLAMEARQLKSIHSKYLKKYLEAIGSDGILRYSLNQLRMDNEAGSGTYGTVTGRFSSSNVNIQQVFSEERQIEKLGFDMFIIRELFVPAPGMLWWAADASQIEYRIIAHLASVLLKMDRLAAAYRDDPHQSWHSKADCEEQRCTDFHRLAKEICDHPYVTRKRAKNINFGYAFGMGPKKLAEMMGIAIEEATPIFEIFNTKFPEPRKLMYKASELAESRGYIKTLYGRRRHFGKHNSKYHAGLNSAVQGSAADYNKLKLLRLYNERKRLELTMRLTVHDETAGDQPDDPRLKADLEEVLAIQEMNLRCPITWNLKYGPNWRT